MNDPQPAAPTVSADASSYIMSPEKGGLRNYGFGVSSFFPNIESFPGELMVKPQLTSARVENRIGRTAAVRQARALERQNEHMRGGLDKRANMVIGATLRVLPKPNWKLLADAAPNAGFTREWARTFTEQAYRQFNDWGYGNRMLCDAEGHYNFGGLMWMGFRLLDGPEAESAGVIHYDQERADAYRHRWATFVTVLDTDRIVTPAEKVDDDTVWQGKQLDKNGRWVGFYATNGHPGDGGWNAANTTFVPRETPNGRTTAWHFFRKTRPGAVRGMTSWITILRGANIFDQFDDATLGNATKAASLATYIETLASAETVAEQMAPAGPNLRSPWESKLDYYDKTKFRIGQQRLPIMPPGDRVVMEGMDKVLTDPSAFRNGFLRMFASSLGLSFEQVSNNFSEANYSSARAALLEIWRGVTADRGFFTAHVASLIYAAVIEEAIAKGRIDIPAGAPDFNEFRDAYTACLWTGPGMGWIDPQKEANAQSVRLANKTVTRESEIAQQGGDWVEVFDQLHEEDQLAEELDINLEPPATPSVAGNPALPGADDPEDPTPARTKNKPAPASATQGA